MMVKRQALRKPIQRPTIVRLKPRRATPTLSTPRQNAQVMASSNLPSFLNSVVIDIKNVLRSTSNLKDANAEGINFVNSINVNPAIKSQIVNLYNREVQILRTEQANTINSVQSMVNNFRAREKQADARKDKARKKGRSDTVTRQKLKEEVLSRQGDAGDRVLSRLKNGELLTAFSVKRFLDRVGKSEERFLKTKQSFTESQKVTIGNLGAVNTFIRDQAQKKNVPSASSIRNRFGLSLRETSEIQSLIKQRIAPKETRQTLYFVDDPVLKQTRPATASEILTINTKGISQIRSEFGVSESQSKKILRQVININKTTGKPLVSLTKVKEPKTFTEKLEKYRQQVIFDRDRAQFGRVQPFKIIGKQFTLAGIGALRGVSSVVNSILNPIATIRSQIEAIKHPVQTIRVLGNEFIIDPLGTIVQFYVFSKTLNLGSKAIKRSPVGRFVQEELFIRAQPKEVRSSVRAIIKSSKIQEKITPFKIKKLNKVDFMEVKTLTRMEARALTKTLKQTDSVVFGSVASRTLSGKQTPVPHDVDLATANVKTFSTKFIENLPKTARKGYALKGEKLIRRLNNEALFDVKPLNRIYPDRSILTKKGFLPVSGYVYDVSGKLLKKFKIRQKPRLKISGLEIPTQKIVKVGGIKLVGFGEQTTRKGLGTLQVLLEKNVRRAKDPASFINSIEIQVQGLRKIKPKTRLGRFANLRKIRKLSDALKILKSKAFARLLEKKVAGILEQFPILKKISVRKLKDATKKLKVKPKIIKKLKVKPKIKKKISKVKLKKVSRTVTKAKKIAKRISKKRTLKQAKSSFSRLPKRMKRLVHSFLPSRLKSKLKSLLPSRIPSKIPKKKPSRLPKKRPSRVPKKKKPSRVPPSKPPSRVPPSRPPPPKPPSKLPPKKPPSGVPPSRPPPPKPPSKIPPPKPPPPPPPKKPPKLRLPTWDSKPKRGTVLIVNARFRVKGRNRLFRLNTSPNRALAKIIRLVDHTTTRSFELIIVGLRKGSDIKTPVLMKKFRPKKSRGSRVLKVVEKTKFAIDTRGEKRGLRISKLLKKSKLRSKRKKR